MSEEVVTVHQLPYEREVKSLHSDGLCWFEIDGVMCPSIDVQKPYDFKPFRVTPEDIHEVYPVVDNHGNPCLFDPNHGRFHYNKGIGRLFAGATVHTHDSLFPAEKDSHTLRFIPGSTDMVSTNDTVSVYKFADELPDPNVTGDKVVIPSTSTGGFYTGQVLVAKKAANRWHWEALTSPTEGVGAATNIKSYRSGNSVAIRWNDPADVRDTYGKLTRKWLKTRVVRKLGSAPIDPYDGVVVVESSVRDYYSEFGRAFIDILPPNAEGTWYYKLFCYSEDGVVSTSRDSQFTPPYLDWKLLPNYIQNGLAQSMFAVGDEITIEFDFNPSTKTGNDSDDSYYRSLTFIVAGFDLAIPTDTTKKHSITLISKKLFDLGVDYDLAWGSFRWITSGTIQKGTTYYQYDDVRKQYVVATNLPAVGTEITPAMKLYYVIFDSRANSGANLWSTSTLRQWLNLKDFYYYALTADAVVTAGKTYYTRNADDTYSPVTNPAPRSNPRKLGWRERTVKKAIDPRLDPSSSQRGPTPPLMAYKLLEPDFYGCIMSTRVTTAMTQETAASSVFPDQTVVTDDYIYVPSTNELTGAGHSTEGKRLPIFEHATNFKKMSVANIDVPYWLRTADSGLSSINHVNSSGDIAVTQPYIYNNRKHVCWVLNLG